MRQDRSRKGKLVIGDGMILVRKDMLVENDITTGKKLVSGEVVEFIGFLANRIPEKHTLMSTRRKLMRNVSICGIGKTTKDA